MPNSFKPTSKSFANRFLTEDERELFSFLKDGPRTYSEICRKLETKGLSKSKSNRLLKKNVRENRIFRIEKGKNVFYKLNDFPVNVNTLVVFINSAIKEKKDLLEAYREENNQPEAKSNQFYGFDIKKLVKRIFDTYSINQELVQYQTLKRNIIWHFPKLDLRQIIRLTLMEIGALASGNRTILDFLEGLRSTLD